MNWRALATPLATLFAGLTLSLSVAGAQANVSAHDLSSEAQQTLRLIDSGGPFPYRRDGVIFQNRERRLPWRPAGYYREYTVPTPGARDRGARRIITGGQPPETCYYTADHYRHFQRIIR